MKKQIKYIHIRGMACGRGGMITTNDMYRSDHLPDRFKPLQYIMEIDDFTSMEITIQDIHYSITLMDTAEPPRKDEPGEHHETMNETGPDAMSDREYYHEVQDRYHEAQKHHDALIIHHLAVQEHQHRVQDLYQIWQKAEQLRDRGPALHEYFRALLDHRRLVQKHQALLQEQYSLLLDLQSAEENGHPHPE